MDFLDTYPTYQEALATRKKKYDKNIKSWKSIFLNCCSPTIPWIDRLGYEYMNYFNCNIESRSYSINIKICIILFYFILISYSCSRADIFSNGFLGEKIAPLRFQCQRHDAFYSYAAVRGPLAWTGLHTGHSCTAAPLIVKSIYIFSYDAYRGKAIFLVQKSKRCAFKAPSFSTFLQ